MTADELGRALLAEARRTNERRLLVLAGERAACIETLRSVLDGTDLPIAETTLVSDHELLSCERLDVAHADQLLGETRTAVVLDCHDTTDPNALGRVVGAIDGGGLLVLLAPPLDEWPERSDGLDESLAVPPAEPADVTGRFRRRLVETLRTHPGIAIVDADSGTAERDGLTDPAPRLVDSRSTETDADAFDDDRIVPPADAVFPPAAYEACLTADQATAVETLESLRSGQQAVVVEADRGRGKSSAAGLAAGALAAEGADVLVTAPEHRNASELFVRAVDLLDALGIETETDGDPPRRIVADGGGSVQFELPTAAVDAAPDCDALLVDEAAAIPVRLLSELLAADRIAFATTVHGYEGTGRGFSVRFRDRIEESRHELQETTLVEPIRYAPGDPVETWAFRALLLDARPPVEPLVADADPDSVEAVTLSPDELLADERLLREAFGLLVLAHYRTEPTDLARLLDGPNVSARALLHDGHVVSVALLAREGGLSADVRRRLHDGGRIRGHMLPDLLTSQLRDEEAAVPAGWRVVRIATHPAVRSRGLGSQLLADARDAAEHAGLDWIGTGFGATPGLLAFWHANGYGTISCSTTRNDRSGEYSALLLDPITDAGRALHDRHARWFADRIAGVLTDALADADPDVIRAVLRTVETTVEPSLSAREWTIVAGAAYGPGLFDVSPDPFRRLAVAHLVDPVDSDALSAREERLLVLRVLQARPAAAVAERIGYASGGQCMRALGDAFEPLVDCYGDERALAVRERYE